MRNLNLHGRRVEDDLRELSRLIQQRNVLDEAIARLIGRPALLGHVGEYIASKVFNIRLSESATTKGIDGHFGDGPLEGRSVNIKLYAMLEGILDIRADALADFFLVLTGPRSSVMSSRGQTRLFTIHAVYLFEGAELFQDLNSRARKIGIASSVRTSLWNAAEVFPRQVNSRLILSPEQRAMLELFQ